MLSLNNALRRNNDEEEEKERSSTTHFVSKTANRDSREEDVFSKFRSKTKNPLGAVNEIGSSDDENTRTESRNGLDGRGPGD